MDEENYADGSIKQVHRHLSLPEFGAKDHNTIYKLTLSMKRRLSPQQGEQATSPMEAGEVRNLLQRLVEIDNESRVLLNKVFLLLEKDESLEAYVKNRIEDPKVSRMWQLVEQVLACQEGESNLNDVIIGDENSSDYITYYDKSIHGNDQKDKEKKTDRFKVKNIGTGFGIEAAGSSSTKGGDTSSATAGATSTTNAGAK